MDDMKLFNEFREFVCAIKRLAQAESDRANADRYLGESIWLLAEAISSKPKAVSATLTLINSKGETMPVTITTPGGQAQALFQEWSGPSGTGTTVAPIGPVTYASDNTAVATVDPNLGLVTEVANGTCNITATDAGNSLTASDVCTVAVTSATAVSATLSLSLVIPPVAPTANARAAKKA